MSQQGTNSRYGMMRHHKAAAHRSKRLQARLEPAFAVCGTPSNYVRRTPMIASNIDARRPTLPFMATAPSVEYTK
jgi:hypothetical protein